MELGSKIIKQSLRRPQSAKTKSRQRIDQTIEKDTTKSHLKLAIIQHILQREQCITELLETVQNHAIDTTLLMSFLPLLRLCTLAVVESIASWKRIARDRSFLWQGTNYLLKLRTDTDFLDELLADSIIGISSLICNPFFSSINLTAPQLTLIVCSDQPKEEAISCIARRIRFGEGPAEVSFELATRVVHAMVHIVREEMLIDPTIKAPEQPILKAFPEIEQKKILQTPQEKAKSKPKSTRTISAPSVKLEKTSLDENKLDLQHIFDLCSDVTTAASNLQSQLRVLDDATALKTCKQNGFESTFKQNAFDITCVQSPFESKSKLNTFESTRIQSRMESPSPKQNKPESTSLKTKLQPPNSFIVEEKSNSNEASAADLVDIIGDIDLLRSLSGRLQTLRALEAEDEANTECWAIPESSAKLVEVEPIPMAKVRKPKKSSPKRSKSQSKLPSRRQLEAISPSKTALVPRLSLSESNLIIHAKSKSPPPRRRSLDHRRWCLLQHHHAVASKLQQWWRNTLPVKQSWRRQTLIENNAATTLSTFWKRKSRHIKRDRAASSIQLPWLRYLDRRRVQSIAIQNIVTDCVSSALDRHILVKQASKTISRWILRCHSTYSQTINTTAIESQPEPVPHTAEDTTQFYLAEDFEPSQTSENDANTSHALKLTYFIEWLTNSLRQVQYRSISKRATHRRIQNAFVLWYSGSRNSQRLRRAFIAWKTQAAEEKTKRTQLRIEFAQDAKAWKKLKSGMTKKRWSKAIQESLNRAPD
ncbi:hypothetical protein THRCLA_07194 [Thraustotheca clavata]|uniref:Uncharacterized protein n=1 Tax=Thraustotheca clavata TaxID=74557 RepID=A0A1V9ZFF7_9STRA|nr:hypothetical protein THRCLA_07194 [Thraustotheca clavata]